MKRWCNRNWNRTFHVYYMCVSIEETRGRAIEYDILALLSIYGGKRVLVSHNCTRSLEALLPPPLISRAACSNRSHRKNLTCRVSKGRPWKPRNKDHDILFYYSRFLKEKKTATLLLTVTSILQSERVLSDLDRQLGMAMQQWGWNSLVVHQVTEIIESWLQLQYYNNTSLLYCTKGPFFDVQQRRS